MKTKIKEEAYINEGFRGKFKRFSVFDPIFSRDKWRESNIVLERTTYGYGFLFTNNLFSGADILSSNELRCIADKIDELNN